MSKVITAYLSDNGVTYPTFKEANQADLRYREYQRGPIPMDVLRRRSGKPKRCRAWRGCFWDPCQNDPKHECSAGEHGVYEIEYHGDKTYWVYHDRHSGGERPFYDRWRVFDDKENLPLSFRVYGSNSNAWRSIKL